MPKITVPIMPSTGKKVARNIWTGTLRPLLLLLSELEVPVLVASPVDKVPEGAWVGSTRVGLTVSTSKVRSVVLELRLSSGDCVDVVDINVLDGKRLVSCRGVVNTVDLDWRP